MSRCSMADVAAVTTEASGAIAGKLNTVERSSFIMQSGLRDV